MNHQFEKTFTFLGYDGSWSLLTKLLKMAKKTADISISNNWIYTAQNFKCPGCHKTKVEIAQLKNNQLLCNLHLDHDHLIDYAKVTASNMQLKQVPENFVLKKLRFFPTVLCPSCNHLDSKLKAKHPDVCKYFSLTPTEKSRIAKISRQHQIRESYQVWKNCQSRHQDKIEKIEQALLDYVDQDFNYQVLKSIHQYKRETEKKRFLKNRLPPFENLSFNTFMKISKEKTPLQTS